MQDLGETVEIKIGVDASVGKAMASRRRLGRAKHKHVQDLWVQSLVQEGSIASTKIPGEEKGSDMMTEHLAAAKQNEFLEQAGVRVAGQTIKLSIERDVTRRTTQT